MTGLVVQFVMSPSTIIRFRCQVCVIPMTPRITVLSKTHLRIRLKASTATYLFFFMLLSVLSLPFTKFYKSQT